MIYGAKSYQKFSQNNNISPEHTLTNFYSKGITETNLLHDQKI